MFCGSEGSNSRFPKAAGAELSGQMRDKKLPAAVALSRFGSKNDQNTSAKLRCRKVHAGAKHIRK
jgi:hypothetical protein